MQKLELTKYTKEITYKAIWDKLREREMFSHRNVFEYIIFEFENKPYRFVYDKNVAEYFGFGYKKNFGIDTMPEKIFLVNIYNPTDIVRIKFIHFCDYLLQGKILILNKNNYTNTLLNTFYKLTPLNEAFKKMKLSKKLFVMGFEIKGFSYDQEMKLRVSTKSVPHELIPFLETDPMNKENYILPYHAVIIQNSRIDKK